MPESYDEDHCSRGFTVIAGVVQIKFNSKTGTTEQDPWHPQNANYLRHTNRSRWLERRGLCKETIF